MSLMNVHPGKTAADAAALDADAYAADADQVEAIRQLRAFCRMEMGTAETYRRALLSSTLNLFESILQSCHASHHHRASLLARRVEQLGGTVPRSPGVWRSVTPLFEQAAATVSAKMAVSLLEQNEEHCLREYRIASQALSRETRKFVHDELLPRELGSHRAMCALKSALP